jgi:hypothetical protein
MKFALISQAHLAENADEVAAHGAADAAVVHLEDLLLCVEPIAAHADGATQIKI